MMTFDSMMNDDDDKRRRETKTRIDSDDGGGGEVQKMTIEKMATTTAVATGIYSLM